MKTQNKEVYFNENEYEAELLAKKKEIDIYNKCIEALERITGSKELKSMEYVKEFICALSGFPSVQKSSELLDIENEYNFLKDNLPNVKSDKSEISKKELEQLKEKHTTRLTDELQEQFNILETIAKEYTKLYSFGYINAIRNNDFGVYSVDVYSFYQINQLMN